MNHARLTFLHALSPLHAGTGQGSGIIDLPIAREKATGLPYLPGSSLKGTLRGLCDPRERRRIFGPETTEMQTDNHHASSIQFSDQRLLLLPVRSLAGIFAWITCPYILHRFARDIRDAELTPPDQPVPSLDREEQCALASEQSKLLIDTDVYLEELHLTENAYSAGAGAWAAWIAQYVFPRDDDWQTMLKDRFCVVHDDIFSFLLETATEITARIKLQAETKTVEDGGLWYEEALPVETILAGIALATPTVASGLKTNEVFTVLRKLTGTTLQFGGKATVGRGLCRVLLTEAQGA